MDENLHLDESKIPNAENALGEMVVGERSENIVLSDGSEVTSEELVSSPKTSTIVAVEVSLIAESLTSTANVDKCNNSENVNESNPDVVVTIPTLVPVEPTVTTDLASSEAAFLECNSAPKASNENLENTGFNGLLDRLSMTSRTETTLLDEFKSTSQSLFAATGVLRSVFSSAATQVASTLTTAASTLQQSTNSESTLQTMLQAQQYAHMKGCHGTIEITIEPRSAHMWLPVAVPLGGSVVWRIMVKEYDLQFGLRERVMMLGGSEEADMIDEVEFGEESELITQDIVAPDASRPNTDKVASSRHKKQPKIYIGKNFMRTLVAGKEYCGRFTYTIPAVDDGLEHASPESSRYIVFVLDNSYSLLKPKTCLFNVVVVKDDDDLDTDGVIAHATEYVRSTGERANSSEPVGLIASDTLHL